ncbi:Polyphenol oxidase, central domain-containing protein, partial [Cynara cardunculus var. scolymus]
MASFSSAAVPSAAPATTNKTNTLPPSPLFSKTSSHRFKTHANQTLRFKISCNAAANDDDKSLNNSEILNLTPKRSPDMQNVDRRNLLLGIGGLYGAANYMTSIPSAFAAPITAPDNISDCIAANAGISDKKDAARTLACCPPVLSESAPKRFVLPKGAVTRVRPAAQRVTDEYLAKYNEALQKMRDLPDDDPRSFKQQAMIHCAYCNGSYRQKEQDGKPRKEIQIHNSWLFFPFHRWYLYFYERILGKLIDDPKFAIPYWNWDSPTGMTIPAMFEPDPAKGDPRKNPIFNAYRDAKHLPPVVVDIDYNGKERGASCIDQISINLAAMYKQMISSATDPISFFGGEYKAGDDPVNMGSPLIGSIESGCHTAVHRWVGNSRMPNNEDMGNFYSAGYDPIFYAHHANVDRMWKIWKGLGIKGHHDPTSEDWLEASYVFYDENKELVRVYNKDCVDTEPMGYEYETSRIPWSRNRPIPRTKKPKIAARSAGRVRKVEDVKFPLKVDRIVKVLVKRPARNRSKEEKEKEKEILFMDGIRFDSETFVKFDVYVDDKDDEPATTAAESEFAGSFAQLPHNHTDKMFITSAARFGLTELLEDIEAEDDDSVLVTI